MKKKFLMLMLCTVMSFSMIAGCGNAADPVASVEDDEEDEDDGRNSRDDEDDEEEEDEDIPEDDEPEEDQPVSMPRSDAYEMFMNGEMDIVVENTSDNPAIYYSEVAEGTYSYDELVEAVVSIYPGEYDVKYTTFTPNMGEEGDDILVICLENHNTSLYSWIGFAAYDSDGLHMRYHTYFGYRSFFDLYFDGYVLYGGSGGAGAQYVDCYEMLPNGEVEVIYRSATLFSSWCDELVWRLDPEYDYSLAPSLNSESNLQITAVYGDAGEVRFCVSGWSDNKQLKSEEEKFVQQIVDLGGVLLDADEISAIMDINIDDTHFIDWREVRTFDHAESPEEEGFG